MANKFVIEVRAKGFTNLETQLKKADAATKGYTKSTKQLRGATSGLRRNIGALRNNILLFTFALGAAAKMTSTFVRNASKFEQVRTRLVGLTGSVVKANQAFDTFNAVAATTPFSLEDVVNAGAQLKAFGSDAEALIKPVTDLAAFMGTTATEAANSFGRAFAGGAGAADILRERGILNIIKSSQGLTDLSTTTLPEFRKALISSLQDPAVGIAGSTDRMSRTFEGAMSNMKDSLTRLSAEVGAVMLPALKGFSRQLKELSDDAITFFQQFTGTEAQKMLAHLKQIGVDSKALSALEAIVFTEKTEENIDNINQAMVRLLQGNKGLTKQFKDFGGEVKTIQEFLFGKPIGEPRIDDVSISVENAALLLDVLKQEMNAVQAGALGMANSIGTNNQATSEASKEAAEHFLALASLVAMLTEQDNLYKRLTETIAELSATAPLVQIDPPDPARILASARAFKQFSDNIAKATLEGQNFGDAVVNALESIGIELAAQAISFSLLSIFAKGPLSASKAGFGLLDTVFTSIFGKAHTGGAITNKGVQAFAGGGMVQGRDNVPILAQAGEFVMRREAVQSIGLDQLHQMNQSGQSNNMTVNISAPMVDETVVDHIIPAIEKAARFNLA
tara:strand:+ start:7466 stop:9328 length:1863 start_codon:yes stop_codon:yes gene_type:complete